MNFFFDNVDFKSSSGPNNFACKLANYFSSLGHGINDSSSPDIQLAFITATTRLAPIIQRLDGIYFNSEQDWKKLNEPIRQTYEIADGVIFQSHFNQKLTTHYFGKKDNSAIIHNGTDVSVINKISPLQNTDIDKFEHVWCCASSWRPHKRLSENVRYFLEHSNEKDCLIIAGSNPDCTVEHERIFYVGHLEWPQLISLYKRCQFFIHLALMDHCPNVVIDARASGCKIICTNSGGTKEIAGLDAVIVKDMEWNFLPFQLYNPPLLDFTSITTNSYDHVCNINNVGKKYLNFMRNILKQKNKAKE